MEVDNWYFTSKKVENTIAVIYFRNSQGTIDGNMEKIRNIVQISWNQKN